MKETGSRNSNKRLVCKMFSAIFLSFMLSAPGFVVEVYIYVKIKLCNFK